MKLDFFKVSDNQPELTPPSLNSTDPWLLAVTWLSCNVPVDQFAAIQKARLAEVSGLDKNYIAPLLSELCVRSALIRTEIRKGVFHYKRLPLINRINTSKVEEATKVRLTKGGIEPDTYVEPVVPVEKSAEELVNSLAKRYETQMLRLPSSDDVAKIGPDPYYIDELVGVPPSRLSTPVVPVEPPVISVREQEPVAKEEEPAVAVSELPTPTEPVVEVPAPELPVVKLPADLTQYGFTINGSSILWCADKADMQERVDGYLEIDGTIQIDLIKRIGKVTYKPTVILDETA